MSRDKICVALDLSDLSEIKKIIDELQHHVGWFKLNVSYFEHGPELINYIKDKGCKVFLDLKFHDIPATVANYAARATELGVDLFNVHASGGFDMMKAALEASQTVSDKKSKVRPKIIAVTVLTSMSSQDLASVSVSLSLEEQVLTLAKLTQVAHLDGVVASAQEAKLLRDNLGKDFFIVTPGIRPDSAEADDQKRIITPKLAVELGSDLLVIGRPITAAKNRVEAVESILMDLG